MRSLGSGGGAWDAHFAVLLQSLWTGSVCSFYIFTWHRVILEMSRRGSQRSSFYPSAPHSDYLVAGTRLSTECPDSSLTLLHGSALTPPSLPATLWLGPPHCGPGPIAPSKTVLASHEHSGQFQFWSRVTAQWHSPLVIPACSFCKLVFLGARGTSSADIPSTSQAPSCWPLAQAPPPGPTSYPLPKRPCPQESSEARLFCSLMWLWSLCER